jgi:Fis family transcriptional regulator
MLDRMKQLAREARAGNLTLEEFTKSATREFILVVLEQTRGNQVKAAVELGVHRNTLRRMLIEHDIKARVIARKQVKPAQKVSIEKFKSA